MRLLLRGMDPVETSTSGLVKYETILTFMLAMSMLKIDAP